MQTQDVKAQEARAQDARAAIMPYLNRRGPIHYAEYKNSCSGGVARCAACLGRAVLRLRSLVWDAGREFE